MDAIGRKRWAIAEGYIPSESSFSHRALVSHETACILNAGDRDAHVTITIFFADRDPVGPYRLTVAGTPDATSAFQRSRRPRVDPARYRLRLGIRIGRADHPAIHPARFPACRGFAAVDHGLSGRLIEASNPFIDDAISDGNFSHRNTF